MAVQHRKSGKKEGGYILLSIMLMMTLMLIALTVELPRIAQQIRREKEEELIHRGEQYKIAIKRYLTNGPTHTYPVSLEQLEKTNNRRYLRKRYKDPFTGKDDWRLLHVGEVQFNPATKTLSAAGDNKSVFGGSGSGFGSTGFGSSSAGNAGAGGTDSSGTKTDTSGTNTGPANTTSNNSAGTTLNFTGGSNSPVMGGGGIIGVASQKKDEAIKEYNGKDHYNEWLFVYDPRMDQPIQPGQLGGQGGQGQGGPAGQGSPK